MTTIGGSKIAIWQLLVVQKSQNDNYWWFKNRKITIIGGSKIAVWQLLVVQNLQNDN
jgi:hypothetical protein